MLFMGYFLNREQSQVSYLRGHKGPVVDVAWSTDGSQVASGSFDHSAILWDAKTEKLGAQ